MARGRKKFSGRSQRTSQGKNVTNKKIYRNGGRTYNHRGGMRGGAKPIFGGNVGGSDFHCHKGQIWWKRDGEWHNTEVDCMWEGPMQEK